MTERLSKLQKWILIHCYYEDNGKTYTTMKKVDIFRYWKNTYVLGSQTYIIKNNFKSFFTESEYNKICATITRTLWNLFDKGYIQLIGKQNGGYSLNFEALNSDIGNLSQQEYLEKKRAEGFNISKTVNVNTPMGNVPVPKEWAIKTDDIPIILSKGCKHNIILVSLTNKGVEKAKSLKLSYQLNNNLTLRKNEDGRQ